MLLAKTSKTRQDYCGTLLGSRPVQEFRLLSAAFLRRGNSTYGRARRACALLLDFAFLLDAARRGTRLINLMAIVKGSSFSRSRCRLNKMLSCSDGCRSLSRQIRGKAAEAGVYSLGALTQFVHDTK